MIPVALEEKVQKEQGLSSMDFVPIEANSCHFCNKDLKHSPKLVLIRKGDDNVNVVCEFCLKKLYNKNEVLFCDTLEFYLKRVKNGFGKSLSRIIKEQKVARD